MRLRLPPRVTPDAVHEILQTAIGPIAREAAKLMPEPLLSGRRRTERQFHYEIALPQIENASRLLAR